MRCNFLIVTIAMSLNTSMPQASASEAETWAQTSGALMGMASACSYDVNPDWIKIVVRRIKSESLNPDDFKRAMKAFESYGKRAFLQQTAAPRMTCVQVNQMMRQSEEKMLLR